MFHRERFARFEIACGFKSQTWIQKPLSPVLQEVEKTPVRGVKLLFCAKNVGKVYAQYVNVRVSIPESLMLPEDRAGESFELDGTKYYVWEKDNTRRDVVDVSSSLIRKYGPSWFDPILPGLYRCWEFDCTSRLRPENLDDRKIKWQIHF